jgi:hypothetical protein
MRIFRDKFSNPGAKTFGSKENARLGALIKKPIFRLLPQNLITPTNSKNPRVSRVLSHPDLVGGGDPWSGKSHQNRNF